MFRVGIPEKNLSTKDWSPFSQSTENVWDDNRCTAKICMYAKIFNQVIRHHFSAISRNQHLIPFSLILPLFLHNLMTVTCIQLLHSAHVQMYTIIALSKLESQGLMITLTRRHHKKLTKLNQFSKQNRHCIFITIFAFYDL